MQGQRALSRQVPTAFHLVPRAIPDARKALLSGHDTGQSGQDDLSPQRRMLRRSADQPFDFVPEPECISCVVSSQHRGHAPRVQS